MAECAAHDHRARRTHLRVPHAWIVVLSWDGYLSEDGNMRGSERDSRLGILSYDEEELSAQCLGKDQSTTGRIYLRDENECFTENLYNKFDPKIT